MLVLASSSPRRKELLQEWGYDFGLINVPVKEDYDPKDPPQRVVEELALRKALAGLEAWVKGKNLQPWPTILGADTIVVLEGRILGKPLNTEDATRILEDLSGRTHRVMTGIALAWQEEGGSVLKDTAVELTTVTFRTLSRQEILDYVETGEPMDKAAAYGIQGGAGKFVRDVQGSLTNVIGLPMELLAEKLKCREIFPGV